MKSCKRVLDLTDQATLEHLGLRKGDIIQELDINSNAYKITHQIGKITQELGFDALLVNSAASTTGKNLVILKR